MMGFKHKIFLSLFIVVLVFSLTINAVSAIQYVIDQEWVTVWIDEDASIELNYNITITYEDPAQGYITIGLPAGGFNIVSVKDLSGNTLTYDDVSSGSYYAVEVFFGHSMDPGDNGTVLLIATVPNMVFPDDEMNPGYVGMEFKGCGRIIWRLIERELVFEVRFYRIFRKEMIRGGKSFSKFPFHPGTLSLALIHTNLNHLHIFRDLDQRE